MSARAIFFAPLIAVVLACSSPPAATPPPGTDAVFGDRLVSAARDAAANNADVDLTDVAGLDWDTGVVFGPYSDSEAAKKELGFDWNLNAASPWTNSEGGAVIVLMRSGQVVAWAAVPSTEVGLHCIYGQHLRRGGPALRSFPDRLNGTPQIYASDEPSCRE